MKLKSECKFFLEKLPEYMAGGFSTGERDRIEAHLSNCDTCRKDLVLAHTILEDEELYQWDPRGQKIKDKMAATYEWVRERCSELASQSWFSYVEPNAALAACAVRSEAVSAEPSIDYIRIVKDIGDVQAEIYVRKAEDDNICMKIRVLKDDQVVKSGRVTLKREGQKEMGRPLRRDTPYVVFDNLIFSQYHMDIIRYGSDGKQTCGFKFRVDHGGIDEQNT